MPICANSGCNRSVPKGRYRYCSTPCQQAAAREISREWNRACRSTGNKTQKCRPPVTEQGDHLDRGMYDKALTSDRNHTGSRYVESVTSILDWMEGMGCEVH